MTLGLLCLTAFVPCLGQEKTTPPKKDRTGQEFGEYEMSWKALATHSQVEFQVNGNGVSIKKSFKTDEKPFFNAFEEGLKPGIYNYQIRFIPNEMSDDAQAASSGVKRMTDLEEAREEAYQNGDREEAKRLYRELLELHDQVSLQTSQLQTKEYDILSKRGQIVIDKNGALKRYDRKKVSAKERKEYLEDLKQNPPQEASDEDFEH